MHWSNWLALGVVILTGVVQGFRGKSGESMNLLFFEFVGIVLAALAAVVLTRLLLRSAELAEPWVVAVLFVLIAVVLVLLARVGTAAVNWSFGSGSMLSGLAWGLVTGWVLAHMVLRVIIEFQGPDSDVASQIEQGPVTREVYLFESWNWLMRTLFHVNLGPKG